jgi:glycosyltransferase involved in cell wall biosynthesis
MNNTTKVAIIYHYIAHYRKPIFDILCKSTDIDYYVVADEVSNISSLNVMNKSEDSSGTDISKKWKKVENIWITKNILWQKGLIKLALNKHFDHLIFLGNMYFISTWIAIILARLRGKKVYFWTHGFRNDELNLKGSIRVCFYRLAHGIFLYGNRAKNILLDKGFSPDKLHVIYNSLDFNAQTQELNKIRSEEKDNKKQSLRFGIDDKIIISTGRITKDKKFALLINALSDLNKTSSDTYKLIIVGDGPDMALVKAKARELSVVDHVVFYGACYEESELALLISMADVFVVPGDIGLSAIHSLTYGTPVVTHDDFTTHKPEFEAIRDGLNGSFYKSGNVADMVEKIRFWSLMNRGDVFDQCRLVVADYYNAAYQKRVIDTVIQNDC